MNTKTSKRWKTHWQWDRRPSKEWFKGLIRGVINLRQTFITSFYDFIRRHLQRRFELRAHHKSAYERFSKLISYFLLFLRWKRKKDGGVEAELILPHQYIEYMLCASGRYSTVRTMTSLCVQSNHRLAVLTLWAVPAPHPHDFLLNRK